MHTATAPHVHRPVVFDAGDLAWAGPALAHLVPHLGLDHAWGLWLDVYCDTDRNFYPILDEPRLVLAKGHPLWGRFQGKVKLMDLDGAPRLSVLETLGALLAQGSGALIDLFEFRDHDLRHRHGVNLRTGCYWRVVFTPQGAVAIVPEDTDGHVGRSTALGLAIDGDPSDDAGLGCLGLEAPRSAHAALATHAAAVSAAAWIADLCTHLYMGEAEGIVWGEPRNTLQP